MNEPTPIHRETVRLIWQNYNTLEIIAELRDKFGLGESHERALELQVVRLRKAIAEAREAAPGAALQMLRDGLEWKEIADTLCRPYLLSSFEVDGIISRARAAVEAEQQQA